MATTEPGPRDSYRSPIWPGAQALGPASTVFPGTIAHGWIGRGADWTQMATYLGRWRYRPRLSM